MGPTCPANSRIPILIAPLCPCVLIAPSCPCVASFSWVASTSTLRSASQLSHTWRASTTTRWDIRWLGRLISPRWSPYVWKPHNGSSSCPLPRDAIFREQLQLAAMVDGDCRPARFAGGIFAGYGHIKSSIPTCVIIFVVKSFGKIW
jgi:hypothetical protein